MTAARIAKIRRPDTKSLDPTAVTIRNVKHLSSYNWIESPSPTIAVPGSPSLWSPPRGPQKVQKDSGLRYIAQNAARHPDSPLEPLFRALYITHPSFDLGEVDLVTDRNNIRKILSFINPTLSKNGLEPFTIEVEVTNNNTAIFCRAETETFEFVEPHEFKGYGHEFEKAYTTNQVAGSTGHHRILSYRFSNLNLIVRYETDGYVGGSPSKAPANETDTDTDTDPENDPLSGLMGSLSLRPPECVPCAASPRSRLLIKDEGQPVSTDSILEIKTRVARKPIHVQEVLPQLWISETPKLVRAYHRNGGVFMDPQVEDVTPDIKRWEEAHQNDLRGLAALIKTIINVARECGGYAIVKYADGGDHLGVWKAGGRRMLPDDLYTKLAPVETQKADPADSQNLSVDKKTKGKGSKLSFLGM
ncbi:hypothetical protein FE257_003482 [Aspergillus nanangensis]|uniref:Geranylgeranyl pyrophosphate synthetase n=1 Tax=Aspergillus nanangensis TaxID=2582783 RepID=A0AAD4GPK4_ASPNN|nr:hypothetical protein FE257_003482 [Aspergillus nanangensis]